MVEVRPKLIHTNKCELNLGLLGDPRGQETLV
jgi:hypothetical protein